MDIDLKEDNQITIEKNKDVISPKIKNEILSSSNSEKIKRKYKNMKKMEILLADKMVGYMVY